MIGEAIRFAANVASLCRCIFISSVVPLAVVALLGNAASAQELAPRAYWPTPNGTNVFVLAYQRITGDIVVDPSLPLTDVDSDI